MHNLSVFAAVGRHQQLALSISDHAETCTKNREQAKKHIYVHTGSHLLIAVQGSFLIVQKSSWNVWNLYQSRCVHKFTFTFMHLADAFIQSDLQYIIH